MHCCILVQIKMSARALLGCLLCCLLGLTEGGSLSLLPSPHLREGNVIYACGGLPVEIPWAYNLTGSETLSDIKWYYEGRRMVAIFADDHFLTLPGFERFRLFHTAGLMLNQSRVADSGNYSVVVGYHNTHDDYHEMISSVYVQIGDSLMTSDGHLHVTMNPVAVKDPSSSNEWTVELKCGTFTYRVAPPFQVEWVTPRGIKDSSYYSQNLFSLLLRDPVLGGNYTCRIPPADHATACLTPTDIARSQGSLVLDQVEAKVMILESANRELRGILQGLPPSCLP